MSAEPEIWGSRFFELIAAMVSDLGSQTEVARRTGLSPSYVSKIVRGEADRHSVKLGTVESALALLGLDLAWLLDESGNLQAWREDSMHRLGRRAAEMRGGRSPDVRLPGGLGGLAKDALSIDAYEKRHELPDTKKQSTEAFVTIARLVLSTHEVVLAQAILDAADRGDSVDLLGRALATLIAREHLSG